MEYEVLTTAEFSTWLDDLREGKGKTVIAKRIVRMSGGLFGDVAPVGEGVSEARIDFGPGYRLYFVIQGRKVIVLLVGGDKSSQVRDIKRAKELAAGL